MPRYDYECLSCDHVFELRQSFNDDPVGTCPRCAGRSRRKFHAVPIIYKGTGFYTTDYARASVPANGTGSDSSESKEESEKTTTKGEKQDSAKGPSSEKKTKSDKTVSSSSKSEE